MIPRKTWDQWSTERLKAGILCAKRESSKHCVPLRSKKNCVDCYEADTASPEPEEQRLPGVTHG